MLTFKEFIDEKLLLEKYLNTVKRSDKEKYAQQVWDILQYSYRDIGGIKGSGFNSVEDMIEKIPFWKLVISNGKVIACILYKDVNGRKLVALGCAEGHSKLMKKMLVDEVKAQRSYGELSKAPLRIVQKYLPDWEKYFVDKNKVSGILNKEIDLDASPEEDPKNYHKQYTYSRKIGNEYHTKMLYGKPNVPIPQK